MASIIPEYIKRKILERDNLACQKCGFKDTSCEELEIHHIDQKVDGGKEDLTNLITLCSICHHYAPDTEKNFENYIKEKIDGNILETFRKRKSKESISSRTIKGMQRKAKEGGFITKAPKGYKIVDKLLISDEDSNEIKQLFQEFLDTDISLTQLAKKYARTPAGMKKLLKNITYIGKVKFNNEVSDGNHEALLDVILFNRVQEKIKQLGWS